MPGGSTLLGYGYFAAVKFAGYTLAARQLKKAYRIPAEARPNVWITGAARTGIGIAFGVATGVSWGYIASKMGWGNAEIWGFFLLLFPVRMVEWLILIRLFFDRGLVRGPAMRRAFLGTLWSYLLDVLAMAFALVAPGGMWIC